MTDTQLLTLSAQLVAVLFGTLIAVLAWMGNKLYVKLEDMYEVFSDLRKEIHDIQMNLKEEIGEIRGRVTRLEERCRFEHDARAQ